MRSLVLTALIMWEDHRRSINVICFHWLQQCDDKSTNNLFSSRDKYAFDIDMHLLSCLRTIFSWFQPTSTCDAFILTFSIYCTWHRLRFVCSALRTWNRISNVDFNGKTNFLNAFNEFNTANCQNQTENILRLRIVSVNPFRVDGMFHSISIWLTIWSANPQRNRILLLTFTLYTANFTVRCPSLYWVYV